MKHIYFFAIVLLSLNFQAQDCNIGNDSIINPFNNGNFASDNLLGVKFTLDQEGTLTGINLIGNGTQQGVQMAVYNDNNGVPNDLVSSTILGLVEEGLTSFSVPPTVLEAGDYWIMAIYEGNGNQSNVNISAGTNIVYYKPLDFGSPPPPNASDFITYTGQDFLYFLDITCNNSTSIDDHNNNSSRMLYPSPASNEIQFSNMKGSEKYQIYNLVGSVISTGIISIGEKINVEFLTNGVYFLKIENGSTLKFIKE